MATTAFDRQVMLDLLLTPTTFTMEMVGMCSLGLAGFDMIGPWGYILGLGGVLGGVGWGITRVIWNPDKIVEDMLQKKKDRARKTKDQEFEKFDKKLSENKDWEVRKCFRQLRAVYNEFLKLYPTMLEALRDDSERQFMELFDIDLKALQRAHDNLLTVRDMQVEKVKKPFLESRAKAIKRVNTSTEKLTDYLAGVAEASDANDESLALNYHDSLQTNLKIMREVDTELNEFVSSRNYE